MLELVALLDREFVVIVSYASNWDITKGENTVDETDEEEEEEEEEEEDVDEGE